MGRRGKKEEKDGKSENDKKCGCFFLHLFFTLYVMFVTKNDVVV